MQYCLERERIYQAMDLKPIDDNLGLFHDLRAIVVILSRRVGLYRTRSRQIEMFTSFDEYPSCDVCGEEKCREILIARDGNRIVECEGCGLWRTSPRIAEEKWLAWLRSEKNERNRVLTENRVRFGVALPHNVVIARSGWYRRSVRRYSKILDCLVAHCDGDVKRIHDVGCGVGLFLLYCKRRGLEVSGNDLNECAVRTMVERFGLKAYGCTLREVPIEEGMLDAVTMGAYIEHSYHPYEDVVVARGLLRRGGALYISTFHVDSRHFDKLGRKWEMFEWNHVYHFSARTLTRMLERAGFELVEVSMQYEKPVGHVVCKKIC